MPLTIFYKKGIYVQFSSDNTLESNTAESSDEDGIMLYYSNDNTLIDNIADLNGGDSSVLFRRKRSERLYKLSSTIQGKVTMSDVRKVFNRYLDPGYELKCCCMGQ